MPVNTPSAYTPLPKRSLLGFSLFRKDCSSYTLSPLLSRFIPVPEGPLKNHRFLNGSAKPDIDERALVGSFVPHPSSSRTTNESQLLLNRLGCDASASGWQGSFVDLRRTQLFHALPTQRHCMTNRLCGRAQRHVRPHRVEKRPAQRLVGAKFNALPLALARRMLHHTRVRPPAGGTEDKDNGHG